jgi:superfamily II DNA/RNA helicase
MLDMGFEPQIREVMMNLPKPHQTLLFSATMPVEVETLAADYLNKPVKVKVGAVSVPTANVAQHLEKLVDAQKVDRLCELLLEEKAEAEKFGGALPMTIVFVERKARADEIMELLNAEGVTAAAFHGGRSQGEREAALEDYKTGRCSVLVATDVAARGLDVKGIAHVVNLDLPRAFEDYVHRVGRTGRAGMTGRSTSFYTDRDSFIVAQIKRALQELEGWERVRVRHGQGGAGEGARSGQGVARRKSGRSRDGGGWGRGDQRGREVQAHADREDGVERVAGGGGPRRAICPRWAWRTTPSAATRTGTTGDATD